MGALRPIRDAKEKVSGQKLYVADMELPGMLYGKMLLSPIAHGKIRSIDTRQAEALPGVYAVATFRNTPGTPYNSAKRLIEQQVICNERIFDDRVRFVGDRVAAVAAETEALAKEAVKRIKVEYEKLPVILRVEEAIKEDQYPIHTGGNIAGKAEVFAGDTEAAFQECDYILEGKYSTQAVHHGAIEPHVAIADWNARGHLTVYSPNQNSFAFRIILSEIFGISYNRIRVIVPAIGGAFGGKLELTVEPVAAILSKMSGRPVKVELDRRETILASRVRHPSLTCIKTGFMKDGTLRAVDFKMYINTGAYASSAMNVAGALSHKVFMAYKSPNMHIEVYPVYTNTIVSGAMRGYGSPQVYFGFQRQMHKIAKFLHMDEAELQKLNMVDPDSKNPVHHHPLGNPRPKDCLQKLLEMMNYPKLLREQEESRKAGGRYRIGIGLALGVHGNNCFGAHRDTTSPMIRMNEDGSCILYTGAHDMGNDSVGMQEQILSQVLGISLENIGVVAADTDGCQWHIGDYSSRGVYVIGAAAKRAAEKMKRELQKEAAGVLGVLPEQIELHDDEAWACDGSGNHASLRQVMIHCQSVSKRELCVMETYHADRGASSYGVHLAKVEVDRLTGETKVLDYGAVHDVGHVINPMMIEGQLEGAILMGLGYGLYEEIQYNDKGIPSPLTLKRYRMPRASQVPKLHLDFVADMDGGEPGGPYGAKSLGESPVVPVAPALVNAVCNALEIELDEIPASPERVRAALSEQICFKSRKGD